MENRYFVLENIPIDECIWNKGGNTMKELIKNEKNESYFELETVTINGCECKIE